MLGVNEIQSLDYIMREGVLLVTGLSQQVVIKSRRAEQVRYPLMQ